MLASPAIVESICISKVGVVLSWLLINVLKLISSNILVVFLNKGSTKCWVSKQSKFKFSTLSSVRTPSDSLNLIFCLLFLFISSWFCCFDCCCCCCCFLLFKLSTPFLRRFLWRLLDLHLATDWSLDRVLAAVDGQPGELAAVGRLKGIIL